MAKIWMDVGSPVLWGLFWGLGGIWMTQSAFTLRRNEQALVGFSIGLVLQTWLAWAFSRFLPTPINDLLSAGFIFGLGLFSMWRSHKPLLKSFPVTPDWVFLLLLAFLFFNIQHGLELRDDLEYLSQVSGSAAGVFFTNPAILPPASLPLAFAGQIQRLAAVFPWNALNLTRALLMALAILLAGAWTRRLTNSRAASAIGSAVAAFGMGTAWLALVFPIANLQAAIMPALPSPLIAPLNLPDGFTNTLFQPLVLSFNPDMLLGFVLLASLLLTFNRRAQPLAGFLLSTLMCASLLLVLDNILSFILAWLVILISWSIQHRSFRLPAAMLLWLGSFVLSVCLAFLYHGDQFGLGVGGGQLSFSDPALLQIFLLQFIPAFCLLPLFVFWGIKVFQQKRWFELSLCISAFLGPLLFLFFFSGVSYAYGYFVEISEYLWFMVILYAAALAWNWAVHRNQSLKIFAASVGLVTVLGGLFSFAIILTALTQNTFPPGLTSLDALVYQDYWNRPDLLSGPIYGTNPDRSETIFGQPVSGLPKIPYPWIPSESGIRYLYIDETDWNRFDLNIRESLNAPCVKLVKEYKAKRGDSFRRILDISACPK